MKNILLIDDDINIRTSLSRELRFHNFHIIPAETGLVAINKLEKQPVDLIIVDIRMPIMGGLEFIKIAAAQFSHIPIIILSGTVTRDVIETIQPYRNQVIDVIAKPWDPDYLLDIITKATTNYDF
ncbi:MAG: response regulator [Spirochaetales bacterium]|nr:response regulator [Spirochaetales bacterium]